MRGRPRPLLLLLALAVHLAVQCDAQATKTLWVDPASGNDR